MTFVMIPRRQGVSQAHSAVHPNCGIIEVGNPFRPRGRGLFTAKMPIRFTRDQLTRFLIDKQALALDAQADLRETPLTDLIQRIGVLRAGAPSGPYLSLAARCHAFGRHDLDRALYGERSLLRIPAMSARWFIVPRDAYPAYRAVTVDSILDPMGDLGVLLLQAMPDASATQQSEEMARRVLEVLSSGQPMTIDELAHWLPMLDERVYHDPDLPEGGSSRLGTRLIPAMCARGLLVRVQPAFGWKSTQYRYASLSAWLPDLDMTRVDRRDALRRLVDDAIRAFGPLTLGDLAHWLGGVKRRELSSAVMSLGSQIYHIQVEGSDGDYLVSTSDLDALTLSRGETGVVLLPPRDSLLSAFADLSRFCPEPHASRLTDRVGEPYGTIWQDSEIVGTWGIQTREERISIRFFEAASPELWATVGERARRLARALDMEASLDMQVEQDDEPETPRKPVPIVTPDLLPERG